MVSSSQAWMYERRGEKSNKVYENVDVVKHMEGSRRKYCWGINIYKKNIFLCKFTSVNKDVKVRGVESLN